MKATQKFMSFFKDYKGGVDCAIYKNKEGENFSKFFFFHSVGETRKEATEVAVADHLSLMSIRDLAANAQTLYVKESKTGNLYLTDRYSESASTEDFLSMLQQPSETPETPQAEPLPDEEDYTPYEEEA